jgi:hypothetical protein
MSRALKNPWNVVFHELLLLLLHNCCQAVSACLLQ